VSEESIDQCAGQTPAAHCSEENAATRCALLTVPLSLLHPHYDRLTQELCRISGLHAVAGMSGA
jgi:hypothetical protein